MALQEAERTVLIWTLWRLLLYIIHIHVLSYCDIYVYTSIRPYFYMDWQTLVYTTPAVLNLLCLCLVPVLSLFSTSLLSPPPVVILRLLFCKGSTGRKDGKHRSTIDSDFFMTLRNQRLRFPEKFTGQLSALLSLCQALSIAHKRFEMTVTPE